MGNNGVCLFVAVGCLLSTSAVQFTHEYAIYFYNPGPASPSTFQAGLFEGSTWSPGRQHITKHTFLLQGCYSTGIEGVAKQMAK